MSVLITDGLNSAAIDKIKAVCGDHLKVHKGIPREQLASHLGTAKVVVIRSATTMDAAAIEAAPNLKLIVRAGEGLDNVDQVAAKARGVMVKNTPGANNLSVAELAMGLMFSCARAIPTADRSMKADKWEKSAFVGWELSGKVLGIVGLGKIGSMVGYRAKAFGMTVRYFDPVSNSTDFARAESLETLVAESDIVSIHVPKIPATTGMIDRSLIQKFKKGSVLINCARGGIVDEAALVDALDSGHIKAAGLDVYQKEPVAPNDPLVHHASVVCMPHVGASTIEASERVGLMAADHVIGFWKENG